MKKKKGISLIVLVITIIVMIILGGAVIISLNNSGVIDRANNAVKSYNEGEVNHIASLAWAEAYLNKAKTQQEFETAVNEALQNNGVDTSKYIVTVTTSGVTVTLRGNTTAGWVQDGLTITKGNVTLEAGDLIQYNAGISGYTGKWKVLGAEDGKLLIMSTEHVSSLGLYGLQGGTKYNTTYDYGLLNGIERLNEICEAYGSGTGAVGSRSIKVEDVDKLTGYDKTSYTGEANYVYENENEYGNKVTYSWNSTTSGNVDYTSTNGANGTLEEPHSNGFSYVDFNTMTKTTVPVNGNEMPTLTNNVYNYQCYSDNKATEMIFGEDDGESSDGWYWLASGCVGFRYRFSSLLCASFGLFTVGNARDVSDSHLFFSNGNESYGWYGVRAVVELSPNINIGEKDNTLGWSYTI